MSQSLSPAHFDPRLIALATSSEQIPPGPYSEDELRKQWNNQADEFNQWESLDLSEQLAWAQVRAIAADRNHRPATPLEGMVDELMRLRQQLSAATPAVVPDGPAVLKSREPASVAPEATGPRLLSPAAQAVDRAMADRIELLGRIAPSRQIAAAVLRAVADQSENLYDAHEGKVSVVRTDVILAIAAELEASNA